MGDDYRHYIQKLHLRQRLRSLNLANNQADQTLNGPPEEAWNKFDWGMAVLATAVAVVSGYTTWRGMHRMFGASEPMFSSADALFANLATILLTLAIQAVLTILCWILGKKMARFFNRYTHDLVGRTSRTSQFLQSLTMAVLAGACLFLSAFFSFNTYFNGLYSGNEEQRIAENAVPTTAIEVQALLNQSVLNHREAERDRLVGIATDAGYLDSLDTIIALAGEAQAQINEQVAEFNRQRLEEERERIRREQEALAEQERNARSIEENEARIEEIGRELEELEDQNAGIPALISEKEAEETAFREEASAQEEGLGDRQAGRGTEWAAAVASADKVRAEITSLENRLAANKTRMEELLNERTNLRVIIGQAQLEAGQEVVDGGNGAVPRREEAPGVEDIRNVEEAVSAIGEARIAFLDQPTPAAYRHLSELCNVLRSAIVSVPELSASVANAQCQVSGDAYISELNANADLLSKLNAFTDACGVIDSGQLDLTNATARFRECHRMVLSAGVPRNEVALTEAYEEIESFGSRFDPDQHEFLKTMQAFSVSPRLAWFAALVSVFQDISVFFMTFIVEFFRRERARSREEELNKVLDADEVTAYEAIINESDMVTGATGTGSHVYEFDFASARREHEPQVVASLRNVLDGLVRRGKAQIGAGQVYQLDPDGFDILRERYTRSRKLGTGRQTNQPAPEPEQGTGSNPDPVPGRPRRLSAIDQLVQSKAGMAGGPAADRASGPGGFSHSAGQSNRNAARRGGFDTGGGSKGESDGRASRESATNGIRKAGASQSPERPAYESGADNGRDDEGATTYIRTGNGSSGTPPGDEEETIADILRKMKDR